MLFSSFAGKRVLRCCGLTVFGPWPQAYGELWNMIVFNPFVS